MAVALKHPQMEIFSPPPPPVFSVIGGRGGGGGLSQVAPKLSWHTWANDLNWSNAKLPANSVLSFKLLKKYLCERWGLLPMYAQSLLLTCRVPAPRHASTTKEREGDTTANRKEEERAKPGFCLLLLSIPQLLFGQSRFLKMLAFLFSNEFHSYEFFCFF